jgi:EAL domain-containing protein (putative c-di-GMP-specific phosphodiesterase class I)
MRDPDYAARVLDEIRQMGVRISIDDFGTGYSSLGYLKRFRIDRLKIDRSFVNDLTTDANDAAIAAAVILMAHSLGLRVVAEGVETEDQLRFLLNNACDEFQGYLVGRPENETEFRGTLARSHTRVEYFRGFAESLETNPA